MAVESADGARFAIPTPALTLLVSPGQAIVQERAPSTGGYQPPLTEDAPGARYLPEPAAQPGAAPAPPRLELITSYSRLDYSDSYVGYRLTPERVAWILRTADNGAAWQMVDMFENIVLNDGHTRGLYEQRLDEVAAQDWSLIPGDDRPGSKQAADELAAACDQINMDALLEHLMLQVGIGFSYAEIPWWMQANGMQVPADVVCVPHRRFAFDPQGRARLTSEIDPYPGQLLERRPGSSWVHGETRRWRKQTQAGALRTIAYWAVFKRLAVRDWLIFAEKFGIPMITGKFGENSSEPTRKALQEAIDALGTEGRAILAADATIEIHTQALRAGSGGGDHLHAGITQLCNSEISKILTAATLTSDTGGPGSFALGKVHDDQKHKLSLADARRIGVIFQRDIGREYLRRNNLTDKAAPPWLHVRVQKLSLLTDAQVAKTVQAMGLTLSKAQMRDQFRYREPSDDDDTLEVPEVPNGGTTVDPADPKEPADPSST